MPVTLVHLLAKARRNFLPGGHKREERKQKRFSKIKVAFLRTGRTLPWLLDN
jgi:hypothetical protein